ncbi:MAG TPA: DUF2914 domain-containing protein [Gammaproteobacteria bacterium]|nr:DUF2914 domain-containing protein [Gammaproteobacteria bacterium]
MPILQLFVVFVLAVSPVLAQDEPGLERRVARAAFTTGIVSREPKDRVLVLTPPAREIYFFTDLRNLKGHTVTHRWQFEGEVMSSVDFKVEGDRWRVYSRKSLPPGAFGEWSVTVLDDTGWPLHVELFRYLPGGETQYSTVVVPLE